MTGLVIIRVWIVPICPALVDTINLQTQNSPHLLTKFRSLVNTKCAAGGAPRQIKVQGGAIYINLFFFSSCKKVVDL